MEYVDRRMVAVVGAALVGGWILGNGTHWSPRETWAEAAAGATPASAAQAGPALLDAVSAAYAVVAERIRPSVVYIESNIRAPAESQPDIPPGLQPFFQERPRSGAPEIQRASGSGFIVSSDGYLLTNAHVVDQAEKVRVRLLDQREFDAKVIGTDTETDIAVLKIAAAGLSPAPLGNSDSTRVGEWVLAIGNPLGRELSFTVTGGIVSAKGRALDLPTSNDQSIQDYLQTDAAINPGNCGGPLVNVKGQVVGINGAIASPTGYYSGYGFAVPINLARRVMDQLIRVGRVRRVALGIRVRDASATDAEYMGLDHVFGVVAEDVGDSSSAAARAGLRQGDVIITVDGQPVEYTGQLQERLSFRQPGEIALLGVARKGGARVVLRVPLREVPAEKVARRQPARSRQPAAPEAAGIAPLGLTVEPLSGQDARELGVPGGATGLVVTAVDPNGPSANRVADVDGGPDVILSVEGRAVGTVQDLRGVLAGQRAGVIVELRLYNAQVKGTRVERIRLGSG